MNITVSVRALLISALFVAALLTTGLLTRTQHSTITPVAKAQDVTADDNPFDRAKTRQCIASALAGRFSYVFEGSIVGVGENRAVGVIDIRPDGTLSAADTASFAGRVTKRTFTGTYTLNPDCTGSAVFTTGTGGDLVVDDNGNGFKLMINTQGTNITGIGRRIFSN
jgi:hypothetical protein